jgi:hypothetical protein
LDCVFLSSVVGETTATDSTHTHQRRREAVRLALKPRTAVERRLETASKKPVTTGFSKVEMRRLELLASNMQSWRSTN